MNTIENRCPWININAHQLCETDCRSLNLDELNRELWSSKQINVCPIKTRSWIIVFGILTLTLHHLFRTNCKSLNDFKWFQSRIVIVKVNSISQCEIGSSVLSSNSFYWTESNLAMTPSSEVGASNCVVTFTHGQDAFTQEVRTKVPINVLTKDAQLRDLSSTE